MRGVPVIEILCVDKNPVFLESCKSFLEREKDIHVDTTLSSGEAIARMNTVVFDVIIADYDLPDTDGIRLLNEVREKYPLIPFIFFTGTSTEEIVIEALNSGADYYMVKGTDNESRFRVLSDAIRLEYRKKNARVLARENLTMFSGMTRHDILNQLMIISGSLELAAEGVQEPDLMRHLARAQAATKTIQRQITFSREYDRLGAGAPVWQPLKTVIRHAFLELQTDSITLDLPEDPLEVFAEPVFEKVFFHIFNYAHRYGETVTRFVVSYHETAPGLVISVSDNGIGISSNERVHLFDKKPTNDKVPGLFLAVKILEVTGMTLRETGEGTKGSRFEILVPREGFRLGSKRPA